MRIRNRNRAPLRKMRLRSVSPETPASHPSPAVRLPQEIVEMITAHLAYDMHSLLACCLTCHSWYLASVANLHHTLITPTIRGNGKPWWPDSFRKMHKLGLFPLVKRFHIQGSFLHPSAHLFSPRIFDHHILRQFSSLTNIRELGIDDLDIVGFMSHIPQYFGHFLPTVQSLALKRPRGSCRQIVFFIGLFQHLEDLKLLDSLDGFQQQPSDDLTLVPPFTPPLRGRFTIRCFLWVGILEDMVDIFGGIRFRHVEFWWEDGVQLLLDACTETLETLWFDQLGPYCEGVSLKWVQVRYVTNDFSANPFDLSQNKFLQALKVPIYSMVQVAKEPHLVAALGRVLSTIKSPTFSEVVLIYGEFDLPLVWDFPPRRPSFTSLHRGVMCSRHCVVFKMLHELRGIRDIQLVLCADIWGLLADYAVWELEFALEATWVKGGSAGGSSRPLVTSIPRQFLPATCERYFPGDLATFGRNFIAHWRLRAWAPIN